MGSSVRPVQAQEEDPLAVLRRVEQQLAARRAAASQLPAGQAQAGVAAPPSPEEEDPLEVLRRVEARLASRPAASLLAPQPSPAAPLPPDREIAEAEAQRQIEEQRFPPRTVAAARPPAPLPPDREIAEAEEQRRIEQQPFTGPTGTLGTAINLAAAQFMPLGKRREELEEAILEKATPEALSHPNVLAGAAMAGTLGREAALMRILGPVAGGLVGRAELVAKAAPGARQAATKLAELAGRSTAASRLVGAGTSAVRGAAEAGAFGLMREAIERGEVDEDTLHEALAYAPWGAGLGALFGAALAKKVSTARTLTHPRDRLRLALDPFTKLGLDPEKATAEDVRRVIRQKAAIWHPDVNPSPEAAETMALYNEAARQALDELAKRAGQAGKPRRGARKPGARAPAGQAPPPEQPGPVGTATPPQPEQPPPAAPPTAAAPVTPQAPGQAAPGIVAKVRRKIAEAIYPEGEVERRAAERAAEVDPLTGFGNRTAFEKARPTAEGDPNTEFVVFDLNNLKAVNDLLGHDAGDQTIKDAAAAVAQAMSEAKVPQRLFRTGGDEIVAIVPAGRGEDVRSLAEKLHGTKDVGGFPVSISGSAGPTFAEADAALQVAKQAAKGGVSYRPSPPAGQPAPAVQPATEPTPVVAAPTPAQPEAPPTAAPPLAQVAPARAEPAEAAATAPAAVPRETPEGVPEDIWRDHERLNLEAQRLESEIRRAMFDPRLTKRESRETVQRLTDRLEVVQRWLEDLRQQYPGLRVEEGRPTLEQLRAREEVAREQRIADAREMGEEQLVRETERLPPEEAQALEEIRWEGDRYQFLIERALRQGRPEAARLLYEEATTPDPDGNAWLDKNEDLERRIAAAEAEQARQIHLFESAVDQALEGGEPPGAAAAAPPPAATGAVLPAEPQATQLPAPARAPAPQAPGGPAGKEQERPAARIQDVAESLRTAANNALGKFHAQATLDEVPTDVAAEAIRLLADGHQKTAEAALKAAGVQNPSSDLVKRLDEWHRLRQISDHAQAAAGVLPWEEVKRIRDELVKRGYSEAEIDRRTKNLSDGAALVDLAAKASVPGYVSGSAAPPPAPAGPEATAEEAPVAAAPAALEQPPAQPTRVPEGAWVSYERSQIRIQRLRSQRKRIKEDASLEQQQREDALKAVDRMLREEERKLDKLLTRYPEIEDLAGAEQPTPEQVRARETAKREERLAEARERREEALIQELDRLPAEEAQALEAMPSRAETYRALIARALKERRAGDAFRLYTEATMPGPTGWRLSRDPELEGRILAALEAEEAQTGASATMPASVEASRQWIKARALQTPAEKRLTPYDTPEVVEAREREGEFADTATIATPEREALRRAIADQLYGSGAPAKRRRADIVMGPPGAGKSSRLAEPLARQNGSLLIDIDKAREKLPEHQQFGGSVNRPLHQEASGIARLVLERAVEAGDNIVLPVVGKGWETVSGYVDRLRRAGYTVHVTLLDVPTDEAAFRAVRRFYETGRFLDPRYILEEVGDKPAQNFERLKTYPGVVTYARYTNDVPFRSEPKLVESGTAAGERGGVLGAGGAEGAGQRPRGAEEEGRPAAAPGELTGELPPTSRGKPSGEPARPVPEAQAERPAPGAPGRGGKERGGNVPAPRPAGEGEEPVQAGGVGREPEGLGGVGEEGGAGAGPRRPSAGEGPPDRTGDAGRVRGLNYHADDPAALEPDRSILQKAKDNIAAIRLLKEIEEAGRPATRGEQYVLAKYSGWGQVPQIFDPTSTDWSRLGDELRDLLTAEEYAAARSSIKNAHYTTPEIVQAIWGAIRRLGFRGGRVLEPAMGAGYFLSLAPADLAGKTRFTGVELDRVSGRISRLLFPESDVRVEGFEETKIPNDFYDLAVSNVPFGKYRVYDPAYRKFRFTIHNFFFAKALDKVRPGGVVAFITTHYTMDAKDPTVRRYLAERADLLAAVRLPNNAFSRIANTRVTTDIIFLRKRFPGEAPGPIAWEKTVPWHDDLGRELPDLPVNEYYAAHPEMMLGKMLLTGKMYAKNTPTLEPLPGADLLGMLNEALAKLPENVMTTDPVVPTTVEDPASIVPSQVVKEGAFVVEGGKLYRYRGGRLGPPVQDDGKELVGTAADRVKMLVKIRDAVRDVITAQRLGESLDAIRSAQRNLQKLYDDFKRKHGPINRRSGNRLVNLEGFRDDPDHVLVAGLENVDDKGNVTSLASIFTEIVVAPEAKVEKVERPEDALVASLNQLGRVDLAHMSKLSGMSEEQLTSALKGRIFENPETGQWEPAPLYLSGNVRAKLAVARGAARADPKYAVNVEALEKVQPKDLTAAEIADDVALGSPWIPTDVVERFIRYLLGAREDDRVTVAYEPLVGEWQVEVSSHLTRTVAAMEKWGTHRAPAHRLISDALNLRETTVVVNDEVDQEETLEAREKQQAIKEQFKRWVFQDYERADRLVAIYNEQFNNTVPYKPDGSHLTFPGMAKVINGEEFSMRPHQKDGVWGILQTGNRLIGHPVGAGKTYLMVAAGMEAKRIGIARKVLYVEPNHLVGQFAREAAQLYPGGNFLVATKRDMAKDRRKQFLVKIAANNWDGVIMAHSTLKKIPMSREFEQKFIEERIEELRAALYEAEQMGLGKKGSRRGGRRSIVKTIEQAIARYEVRLRELENREAKDDLLSFEELGVDMIFVDEAHLFKNLYAPTKLQFVRTGDAQRAFDLFMKTRYLNSITPGRGVVFATGTPISNTVFEMYTMTRYLAPRLLEDRGISHVDSWAANFVDIVNRLELRPEGGFRMYSRPSRFRNLPELIQMFRSFADIKTDEELNIPKPKILGGKPRVVSVPMSPELERYQQYIMERAERIRAGIVNPTEDNMLKLTIDGRKAALDMRLIDPRLPDRPDSKVNTAVDLIYRKWEETKAQRLTILVFSDMSTPSEKPGEFSVYDDIKRKLIAKGVPANEIAFVHDAKNESAKERLFAAVRAGNIRILMGSTEKMGIGTNVQDRVKLLVDLDAPYRPVDIEQRHGRAIRQGNKNDEVEIVRLVTEKSFDGYIWQLLESKARFIGQAMSGQTAFRRMEDVDDRALEFEEVKAIVTGNPLVFEKARVDAEVARLTNLKGAKLLNDLELKKRLAELPAKRQSYVDQLEALKADAARIQDTSGEKFAITLQGQHFTKRKEAGEKLMEIVASLFRLGPDDRLPIGQFGGFDLIASNGGSAAFVTMAAAAEHPVKIGFAASPMGAIQSLEATLRAIPNQIPDLEQKIAQLDRDATEMERIVNEPFDKEEELNRLLARQRELTEALQLDRMRSDIPTDVSQIAEGESGALLERVSRGREEEEEADEEPGEAPDSQPTLGATPTVIQERLEALAGIPDEVREALPHDPTPADIVDVLERLPRTRLDRAMRDRLIQRLADAGAGTLSSYAEKSDREVVADALANGLIDDVTVSEIARAIRIVSNEGGFLRVGGGPPVQPPPPGGVPPGQASPGGPRVYAEMDPPTVGIMERWVMPFSRIGKRMVQSKRKDVREIGSKLLQLYWEGQAATLAFSRFLEEADHRLNVAIEGLGKPELELLLNLLDQYEALPQGWKGPAQVKRAFDILRPWFRENWRRLGENERLMLSNARRAILDLALAEWPVGGPAPDFDNIPVNRQNIMDAAAREGITTAPTTRQGWEDLVQQLKDAGRRVQRPVFMDSPDLRRIFDMVQGRGGIMAYFPHVFKGDWVVRAGPHTARFVDREEAADYARGLLEKGLWSRDILIERDAFVPEWAVYLSRKQYFRLVSALERETGEEAAVLTKQVGAAGIKIQPRRRWYAHTQPRLVNLQTFEKDLIAAMRVYHYRTAKKLAFDPFRKAGIEIAESLPTVGGWREFALQYVARVQGVPQPWVEAVNNTLERLGFKPWALQRAATTWQSLMSVFFLGYSPVTAAVNLTQLATNVIPRFESQGERWFWTGVRALARSNAEDQEVLDEVGIKLMHPKHMAGAYLPRKIQAKEESWFMPLFMFNKTEDVNRGITALARYYERRAKGFDKERAVEEAREFTYDTNFDYTLADAPGALGNPLGRAVFQFWTFNVNELFFAESLFRWGNPAQRARFVAYLMALGGLRLLAYGTPLWVLNWLSGQLGLFHDEHGNKQTAWDELVDHVPNAGALWRMAQYGLFGLIGLDLSQRLGFGGPEEFRSTIPGRQARNIARALTADTKAERDAAMKNLLPAQVARILRAWEANSEGKVRDRFGRVVDDTVSTLDLVGLGLGVQTIEQSERQRQLEHEYAVQDTYRSKRRRYLDRAVRAMREGGLRAVGPVLREAKKDGVTITVQEVRQQLERLDQPDIERRIQRTPKEVRPRLFPPEVLPPPGRQRPQRPAAPVRPER